MLVLMRCDNFSALAPSRRLTLRLRIGASSNSKLDERHLLSLGINISMSFPPTKSVPVKFAQH